MIFRMILVFIFRLLAVKSEMDDACPAEPEPQVNTAKHLRAVLLCGYDPKTRPVRAYTNITDVQVEFKLESAYENMPQVYFYIKGFLSLRWKDEHLVWDPIDFDGLGSIEIGSELIWTPDITIYNDVMQYKSEKSDSSTTCELEHTGEVHCTPEVKISSPCSTDLSPWPLNKYSCTVKLGSWLHSGLEMNVSPGNNATVELPTDTRTSGSGWFVHSANVTKSLGAYHGVNYPTLTYTFNFKKHHVTEVTVVIVPCAVMWAFSICALWTDIENKYRLHLNGFNIVLHIMYLRALTLGNDFRGPSLPYAVFMVSVSFNLIASIIVETIGLRIISGKRHTMPAWLAKCNTAILNTKPGQMFTFFQLNLKKAADTSAHDEDSSDLIDTNVTKSTEWKMFVRILDRITFVIFTFTYLVMSLKYLYLIAK